MKTNAISGFYESKMSARLCRVHDKWRKSVRKDRTHAGDKLCAMHETGFYAFLQVISIAMLSFQLNDDCKRFRNEKKT